ncbi:hypothetical protein [Streptomyces sp. NPDC008150]|uniref:hypothetical protein n=1 Tax=Streptomyces sp. NPDC008150 TaxID=3364816 RepID=UPI0036E7BEFE
MAGGGDLAERIGERRDGVGDPRALVGELRRAVLLVPLVGGELWAEWAGGIRWVCAFTGEVALARFALARGEGQVPWDYAALLGARIVDEIVPVLDGPTGIAVDVATEGGAMFFPPVTGIVPDAVAVDRLPEEAGRER